jgi:hypothetical protein
MLQVNRHAHLVEQIHAEDAVNRPAAGRTDGAQVDRRQFEIAQRVFPSVVAPFSAGLAASIAQYKGSRLGLFAARLNQLANSRHLYPIVLHDITSGNNGFYSAGPGWDPPTGWGSPDGYMLMLNY